MRWVCLLAVACAGCFFGDGGGRPRDAGQDAEEGWDGGGGDRYTTIRAIRAGELPLDAQVWLRDVVVTAVWPCAAEPCDDDVFLADSVDSAGDADTNLGLMLAAPTDVDATFAPRVVGAVGGGLVEGDRVEVTGRLRSIGVVADAVILSTDGRASTRVPTIPVASLASAAEMAPYEAMVVSLRDVPIGMGGIRGGGSVSAALTPVDALTTGTCAASVSGLIVLGDPIAIVPRIPGDLDATPSSTCPAYSAEYTLAECSDGLDNDWDGRIDCELGECWEGACVLLDTGVPATTVTAVQSAATPPADYTKLDDVVIVGANPREQGGDYWELWVSDAGPTTAIDAGIRLLYNKWSYDFRAVPPGTVVDVVGLAREYTAGYDGSSVTQRRLEYGYLVTGALGAVPAPTVLTATQLTTTASRWEGQLVEVENHRLTSGFNPNGFGLLSDGTSTILLSERMVDLAATIVPGTCFAQVTGVVIGECGNRPATNPCAIVAPRSIDDLVQGGTCP